jgi:arsenate reductase
MALTLWHNPRCSKSRAALSLLGTGAWSPSCGSISRRRRSRRRCWRWPGAWPPLREILAGRGTPYRDLDLADADDAALARRWRNPILLERPILDTGTRAVIGRPPENILSLL